MFSILGSLLYQRALLVSYRVMCYWKSQNLPIASMLEENITYFSEESGEIALSGLSLSLPSNHKRSIETRRYYEYLDCNVSFRLWQQHRLRKDEAKMLRADLNIKNPNKQHRLVGEYISFISFSGMG